MEPLHDLFAELTHARNRVAELEGKLKIATENCAQAVKERDLLQEEVFNLSDKHDERIRDLLQCLAAAEVVCERAESYKHLLPLVYDEYMEKVLAKWRGLKEKP